MITRYIRRPGKDADEHHIVDTHDGNPHSSTVAIVWLPAVEVDAMIRKLNARHTVRAYAGRKNETTKSSRNPRSPR